MKRKSLIKALAIAGYSAGALFSTAAHAAYTELAVPAIVESASFPADMADWLANPTSYSWHPENVRLGNHPDRIDPNGVNGDEPGVIYIFPDGTTANNWWDGTGSPPAGIPDAAVAYIHWQLDNGSGEFPGIMAKTDDKKFKTNNCIMASGTTIPTEDGTGTIAKTCGNYQGSSKRLKLVVMQADANIDLMFNTTTKDLTYDNYDQIDVQDDVFRTYRYIMKFGNGTGTDTEGGARAGTRLVGFKVQLGTGGVGGDFNQTTDIATHGIGYELNLCIDDKYFDEKSNQPNPGTSDCPAGQTEVWLENEYATFSPAMYSLTTDKRTAPVGGYWDKNPAGIFAPQTQLENELDAGSAAYIPNVDSDNNPYDPFPPNGQIGQTTTNYFDVAAAQGAGSVTTDMFGYMMFYGVFEDGDPGNISSGIYMDDDGDPATEGGLYAWWDGSSADCCYRWGIDRDFDGTPGPNAWEVLTEEDLAAIADRPLDENAILPPPRYEIGYMDDLGGLNTDTFIKMNKDFAASSFTIRMVAQSTADAGLVAGNKGVDDGPWVANPPADIFANIAPVIGGTVAGQAVDDTDTISPFATVTIVDPNDYVTTTITLDDNAKGVLSGAGLNGPGPYTISSMTASAAQSVIRALEFDPTENRVNVGLTETTTFTIDVDDGEFSDSDSVTTVESLSINQPGSITLPANVTDGDTLTATVVDSDGVSGPVTYEWKADAATVGVNSNTYTLTAAEIGKVITVTATYTDDLASAEVVVSNATNPVAAIAVNPPVYKTTKKDGLFGFSWITTLLFGLGLLLRRKLR